MPSASSELLSPSVHAALAHSAVCFSRYFPPASTKEMLAEWRPLLCAFDGVMQKAISNMELFLPTISPPEEHGQAFRSAPAPASSFLLLTPTSCGDAGLTRPRWLLYVSLSLSPWVVQGGGGWGFRLA